MKRPVLLARFPSLRTPRTSTPVIDPDARATYPTLAEDFAVLDEVVGEAFRESDLAALDRQNRYRRQQMVVLVGSALLSGFAAVQAIAPDQRWPGVVVAVVGLLLATASRTADELHSLAGFLSARVRAERLRSLHFRYLSRTGAFAGPDRVAVLRRAVVDVQKGKEPS